MSRSVGRMQVKPGTWYLKASKINYYMYIYTCICKLQASLQVLSCAKFALQYIASGLVLNNVNSAMMAVLQSRGLSVHCVAFILIGGINILVQCWCGAASVTSTGLELAAPPGAAGAGRMQMSSNRRLLMAADDQQLEQVQVVVVVVDQNGEGQFYSIQDAVDAIQQGPATIQINAGTYTERVVIPTSLSYITMQGAGMGVTIIEYNLKAADVGVDGMPLTAYNAATVTVLCSNFVAKDLTFQNTQPPPPPGVDGFQAPAFKVSGDKAAFYRCAFIGAQDTLCDDQGRHYFEECYVQGSIDFIFGNGRSLYKNCELHSIAQGYGSIAAQDRQSGDENTGFSFVGCKVTGSGPIYLGRAMGPYSLTVFAYSHFDAILDPRGWDDWDHDHSKDQTVFFGQYQCDGPGADESGRVAWSHELSNAQVQSYLGTSFIDGEEWLSST